MAKYRPGTLICENPLAMKADVEGFRLEGQGQITFPEGRMRMANVRDPSEAEKANFVYWCPQDSPSDVAI